MKYQVTRYIMQQKVCIPLSTCQKDTNFLYFRWFQTLRLSFLQPVSSEDFHLQAWFHAGHTLKTAGLSRQLRKEFVFCPPSFWGRTLQKNHLTATPPACPAQFKFLRLYFAKFLLAASIKPFGALGKAMTLLNISAASPAFPIRLRSKPK